MTVLITSLVSVLTLLFVGGWLHLRRRKSTPSQTVTQPATQPQASSFAAGITKARTLLRGAKPHITTSLLVALGALAAISAYVWVSFPSARPYLLPIALPIGGAVVISSLVAEKVKSDLGKLALVSLTWVSVVAFAIVPALMSAWPSSTSKTNYTAPAGPKLTPSQASELAQLKQACPNKEEPFVYEVFYKEVNLQSKCLVYFWHEGHCIYMRDARHQEHGPFCAIQRTERVDIPRGIQIRAVRSARIPFKGSMRLDPDYVTLSFIYRE